jgi:hypothetical protein
MLIFAPCATIVGQHTGVELTAMLGTNGNNWKPIIHEHYERHTYSLKVLLGIFCL